jgi:CheY-like chemotaxis protein
VLSLSCGSSVTDCRLPQAPLVEQSKQFFSTALSFPVSPVIHDASYQPEVGAPETTSSSQRTCALQGSTISLTSPLTVSVKHERFGLRGGAAQAKGEPPEKIELLHAQPIDAVAGLARVDEVEELPLKKFDSPFSSPERLASSADTSTITKEGPKEAEPAAAAEPTPPGAIQLQDMRTTPAHAELAVIPPPPASRISRASPASSPQGNGPDVVAGADPLRTPSIPSVSPPTAGSTSPVPQQQVVQAEPLSDHGKSSGPKVSLSVLCAEDIPVNQKVLHRILTQQGHSVVMTANGEEAVRAFTQQGPFDIVLLDICMPVMDGITASKEMRKIEAARAGAAGTPCATGASAPSPPCQPAGVVAGSIPPSTDLLRVRTTSPVSSDPSHRMTHSLRVPIHAVTASGLLEDEAACAMAGMDGVLPKPLTPQALRALLKPIIARKVALSMRSRLSSASANLHSEMMLAPAALSQALAAQSQASSAAAAAAATSSTLPLLPSSSHKAAQMALLSSTPTSAVRRVADGLSRKQQQQQQQQ